MKIERLKYLALEGGGAKGAVYYGGIVAIEKALQKEFSNDAIGGKKAILDYLVPYHSLVPENKPNTRIQGIAGASAGAITAFAIALGFSSDDIKKILNYEFEKFLKEKDVGKYRMVGQNEQGKTTLYVGQDHKKKLGGKKEEFKFLYSKYFRTSAVGKKWALRQVGLTLAIESVASGLMQKLDVLQRLFTQKNIKDWFPEDHFLFKMLNLGFKDSNYFETSMLRKLFTNVGIFKIFQLLLTKVIFKNKINKPLTIDIDTIGNLFLDRGMFSGFAIREFFFDVIIFSLTKDTHFRRNFFKYHNIKKENQKKFDFGFEVGKREKYKDQLSAIHRFIAGLETLTFKEFYTITNFELAFNVTNFSTDSPMFFSHNHTPDFPILEAVAAAMTIPPAIKPLYNEADVIHTDEVPEFVKDGQFNMNDYFLHEIAVKKFLSEYSEEKYKVLIDTNNPLNRSAFMPLLHKVIQNEERAYLKDVCVNGLDIKIDRTLLIFYYNSAYKGMFMDGGVTCNIPYNYFRRPDLSAKENNESLKGVLALKLDNEYPKEFMNEFDQFKSYDLQNKGEEYWLFKKKLGKLLGKELENEGEKKESLKSNDEKINDIKSGWTGSKKALRAEIKKILRDDKFIWDTAKKLQDIKLQNMKADNPWQQKKMIFGIFGTLQYGTEEGQVKYISDHNHIIPLYSYGIGVYDFDMTKLDPLIKLSQMKAEEQVSTYFLKD